MQKNTASQKLIVFAFDSTTNLPKSGDAANITAYVSKDYGSVTVLGDTSATEMDSTNAKGYYLFDLTQSETDADTLLFSAKSSTSNIVVIGAPAIVFTDPPNFSAFSLDSSGRVDAIKINSVSASSVTTINANVGTTQPVNFTGTGASALAKSDMTAILATTLTETAGQIAAAFKKWFNVATPTGTVNSIPDAVAGAAGGLFIAGTNAATTVTTALTTTFTGNLTGSVASVTGAVGSVTGAVGSVTGNVGGNVTGSVGSVVGAVGSVAGNVDGNVTGSVGSLASQAKTDVFVAAVQTQMSEGYAADGAAPTMEQFAFAVQAFQQEKSVSGTTMTVNKLDGSTPAMTFTLDSSTAPTSITRAT